MKQYTAGQKLGAALGLVASVWALIAVQAGVAGVVYGAGHGVFACFAALVATTIVWSVIVTRPVLARVRLVMGDELRRAHAPSLAYRDLAFAVAAAFARKGGDK